MHFKCLVVLPIFVIFTCIFYDCVLWQINNNNNNNNKELAPCLSILSSVIGGC